MSRRSASHTVHGRKAVAPLKPQRHAADSMAVNAVHGRKAVAPLKPDGEVGAAPVFAAVHGRKAVAPLKHFAVNSTGAPPEPPSTAARPWPH